MRPRRAPERYREPVLPGVEAEHSYLGSGIARSAGHQAILGAHSPSARIVREPTDSGTVLQFAATVPLLFGLCWYALFAARLSRPGTSGSRLPFVR